MTYADFRVASALPFVEASKMPIGDYKNIVRWNDQLNVIDAWRNPFDGFA